jgi:hypothetical protein
MVRHKNKKCRQAKRKDEKGHFEIPISWGWEGWPLYVPVLFHQNLTFFPVSQILFQGCGEAMPMTRLLYRFTKEWDG